MLSAYVNDSGLGGIYLGGSNSHIITPSGKNQYEKYNLIFTSTQTGTAISITDSKTSDWALYKVKNVMLLDLTLMSIDNLTVEEVEE